jgi:hypothetical protein
VTPTETLPEWKRLQERSFVLQDLCDAARGDEYLESMFSEAYEELVWTEERLEQLYKVENDREERDLMEEEANR